MRSAGDYYLTVTLHSPGIAVHPNMACAGRHSNRRCCGASVRENPSSSFRDVPESLQFAKAVAGAEYPVIAFSRLWISVFSYR
jgi:hypothetical protein